MSVSLLALIVSAASATAAVVSAFNADLEGWSRAGAAHSEFEWAEDAGRDGAGARFNSSGAATGDWILAPAQFLGDWSSYGGLMFDLRRSNDALEEPLSVTIVSTNGTRTLDLGTEYGTRWQTVSIDLREQVFPYVDESSITEVRFNLDMSEEAEETFLDNVDLVPVWRPATAILALCGVLAILFLQRPLAA